MGKVYEQSKNCKLELSFLEKIDNELIQLSKYFNVTKHQSFFIAIVFALNYQGDTVDMNDLIKYFDCNPMKILEYSDDFEYLYSKGILSKFTSKHRIRVARANDQFTINKKITEAILQNKPMPIVENTKIKDVIEFLERIYSVGVQRDEDVISTKELFSQSKELISSNLHFPLVKRINDFQFDISDTYLYLYLIWKTLEGSETTDIGRAIEGIYDKPSERVNCMQKILSTENALLKFNLIEICNANFFNDTKMKLSDYSLDLINENKIKLFTNRKLKDNVIKPIQIPYRKLIFNEDEMKQLGMLKNLLLDSNLSETQNRLVKKGLPRGVSVLLHGSPGTGKTETVMQLAKETDREIMKVEISKSKSMWFGESEKIVKRIFTDYTSFKKECKKVPILLFNEADAIISKRREISNSNTMQTENTIQNIILEEIETFEGILIATTNLVNNLDSAFERRFLFKIKFQIPDISIKTKIWKLKLPNLSKSDCNILASQFDFSGGQIDNIVRKNEIHEIIHGGSVSFKSILDFCNEEMIGNNITRIGFTIDS